MWTDEQVKEHVHERIHKYCRNASAMALSSYYKGCDWRFDKLRAFCEQEIKNFTQELARKKSCQEIQTSN